MLYAIAATLIAISPLIVCLGWSYILPSHDIAAYKGERREERLKRWRDDDKFFTKWLHDIEAEPKQDVHHSMYRRDTDAGILHSNRGCAGDSRCAECRDRLADALPQPVQTVAGR